MNILGCLDRPSSGKYWFDGQEMSRLTPNQRALVRTEKLGFVFQSFNLLPRTTALHNVIMPLDYAAAPALRRQRPAGWAEILLDRVGLADRADHEPSQMSGGQQQRVAIARSLVNRPALVLADEPTGNLDSHTSVEILRMFQQLNAEGITVILVTHDPKVAAYAHRTIRIADGQIESDESEAGGCTRRCGQVACRAGCRHRMPRPCTAATATASPAAAQAATRPSAAGRRAAIRPSRPGRAGSLYGDAAPKPRRWTCRRCCRPRSARRSNALRRNKMRSALTALGVIIGVGAVIAMMEIGQGSKAAMQKTIASMGANTLMVQPGAAASGGVSFGAGSVLTLTPQDADEIARQCPAVADVAPIVRARAQIVYGNRNWVPMQISGTTPVVPGGARLGGLGRGRDVHRPRRPQRAARSA